MQIQQNVNPTTPTIPTNFDSNKFKLSLQFNLISRLGYNEQEATQQAQRLSDIYSLAFTPETSN